MMTGIVLECRIVPDFGQHFVPVGSGHVQIEQDDSRSRRLGFVREHTPPFQVVDRFVTIGAMHHRVGNAGLLERPYD